jgi:hypothetical protein
VIHGRLRPGAATGVSRLGQFALGHCQTMPLSRNALLVESWNS